MRRSMTRSPRSPRLGALLSVLLSSLLAALALAACGGPSSDTPGARKPAQGSVGGRVVVVSIDGMMPETYLEPDRLGL